MVFGGGRIEWNLTPITMLTTEKHNYYFKCNVIILYNNTFGSTKLGIARESRKM